MNRVKKIEKYFIADSYKFSGFWNVEKTIINSFLND